MELLKTKKFKPIKYGSSYFIIIPSEYVKVYNLANTTYNVSVENNGEKLIYHNLNCVSEKELDLKLNPKLNPKFNRAERRCKNGN